MFNTQGSDKVIQLNASVKALLPKQSDDRRHSFRSDGLPSRLLDLKTFDYDECSIDSGKIAMLL